MQQTPLTNLSWPVAPLPGLGPLLVAGVGPRATNPPLTAQSRVRGLRRELVRGSARESGRRARARRAVTRERVATRGPPGARACGHGHDTPAVNMKNASQASACGELWPLAPCGTHGECDERAARCVCELGWQLNPLAVDGVELCNQPRGFLLAVYTCWLLLLASNAALHLARVGFEWRGGRLVTRTARVDAALECVFLVFATCAVGVCREPGVPPPVDVVGASLNYVTTSALSLGQLLNFSRLIRSVKDELGAVSMIRRSYYTPASVTAERSISCFALLAFVTGRISAWTHWRYVSAVVFIDAIVGLTNHRR